MIQSEVTVLGIAGVRFLTHGLDSGQSRKSIASSVCTMDRIRHAAISRTKMHNTNAPKCLLRLFLRSPSSLHGKVQCSAGPNQIGSGAKPGPVLAAIQTTEAMLRPESGALGSQPHPDQSVYQEGKPVHLSPSHASLACLSNGISATDRSGGTAAEPMGRDATKGSMLHSNKRQREGEGTVAGPSGGLLGTLGQQEVPEGERAPWGNPLFTFPSTDLQVGCSRKHDKEAAHSSIMELIVISSDDEG